MNCPKCNASVPEEFRFCGNCGFEISLSEKCQKCGAAMEPDTVLCPKCGATRRNPEAENSNAGKVTAVSENTETPEREELDVTMAIPVIKNRPPVRKASSDKLFPGEGEGEAPPYERKNAAREKDTPDTKPPRQVVSPEETRRKKEEQNRKKTEQRQNNVLVFLIVFFLVIIIGLVGLMLYMNFGNSDSPGNKDIEVAENGADTLDDSSVDVNAPAEDIPDESEEEEETPEEPEDGSSRAVRPFEPGVQLSYGFVTDKEFGDDEEIFSGEYKTYEDYNYSFTCIVPAGFRHESDGESEVRYSAKDKTAYMDIGAMANSGNWSLDDVLKATLRALGDRVEYETDGRSWFVAEAEEGEICCYRKCYVDDKYVRYFEFVYPSAYRGIYAPVVADAEKKFRVEQ